jgi:hypothetical protein
LIALAALQATLISQFFFADLFAEIAMWTNDKFHFSPIRKTTLGSEWFQSIQQPPPATDSYIAP